MVDLINKEFREWAGRDEAENELEGMFVLSNREQRVNALRELDRMMRFAPAAVNMRDCCTRKCD